MDSLALPENGGGERRRSQDFEELRQKFVDMEEGGGVQEDARPKSRSTQLSRIISTQGRGAMRKLCFSNFNISSMVGREGTVLANIPANKKRKRGLESESMEGTKRYCWIMD